jgi:hypothetical protein
MSIYNRPYTPQEDAYIKNAIGKKNAKTVARKLKRGVQGVRQRMYLLAPPTTRRKIVQREIGLSRQQLATELGVDVQRVHGWIARGLLKERRMTGIIASWHGIDVDAVDAFLYAGGALLDYLRPTGGWIDVVADARAQLQARYVSRSAIVDALRIRTCSLRHLRLNHGFPEPSLPSRGTIPSYYDRAAVRAWLAEHPVYQTKRSREI